MMSFSEPTILGRTGLRVGRLGIASSYGVPTAAIEQAFERGCNYLSWRSSLIRGRSRPMTAAIRNLIESGQRDKLVLALSSYSHSALLLAPLLERGLRTLGTDRAELLILGYYPGRPSRRTLDAARKLQQRGLIQHVGISSHNRKLFASLTADDLIDVFQVRYNAAHRGAETETFPHVDDGALGERRPGIISFTATRWAKLIDPGRTPPNERTPTAADCYRFVLSHPAVDLCMVGARDHGQLREALQVLDSEPMSDDELGWMRRVGDHVHG